MNFPTGTMKEQSLELRRRYDAGHGKGAAERALGRRKETAGSLTLKDQVCFLADQLGLRNAPATPAAAAHPVRVDADRRRLLERFSEQMYGAIGYTPGCSTCGEPVLERFKEETGREPTNYELNVI